MKLSILIPVHNGLPYTKKCLRSLTEQLADSGFRANVIIIVVDDGSQDGTTEWIKTDYPDIIVLNGDGSLWWSGSINKGVEYTLENTNAEYILWWNNDILSSDNYFEELFKILRVIGDNHLVGSKIYRLNEDRIWGMGGSFNTDSGEKFMYGEQKPDGPLFQNPIDVEWFPGMGTTIHRSVYKKIGLLDDLNFPQYHGDSDFTFRAWVNGFALKAYPQLQIYNDVSNTGLKHDNSLRQLTKSLTSIKSNFNLKKDILFYKKHATSIRAYNQLLKKYGKYTGGFIKWKLLGFFGKKRKN